MSDKPLAVLVTAIIAAPLCLLCALGPAFLIATGASVLAWLGDAGVAFVAAVAAVGAWLAWRALNRNRKATAATGNQAAPDSLNHEKQSSNF